MDVAYGTSFVRTSQSELSTTAEEVAEAEPYRRGLILQNLDSAETIYWGYDSTVSPTTGGRLLAGESVYLPTRAAVWMEAGANTPTVAITRFLDVLS